MENLKDNYPEDGNGLVFVNELAYAISDLDKTMQYLQKDSPHSERAAAMRRVIEWYIKVKDIIVQTGNGEGTYMDHDTFVSQMDVAIELFLIDDPKPSHSSVFSF